jgi:O-acetylserine/cysteine efflux transporter
MVIGDAEDMKDNRRLVFPALIAAGLLWGTTIPLSKLALGWLAPAWLAFGRFAVAAAILLTVAGWDKVRAVCRPSVLASGAAGYGGAVLLQNIGVTATSVTHAALIVGATPVLIAIIAALWHRTVARPVAWAGFAVSLGGVALVASGRGGGASLHGDALVLAAQLICAAFTVGQARRLRGRDPVAMTGVQFLAAAVAALPIALVTAGTPGAPAGLASVLATAGLALGGTVLPFTLFAFAQSKVSADVAGAFLNLEPLVGAIAGALMFRDPVGPAQVAGGAAILLGIGLGSLQLRRARPGRAAAPAGEPVAGPVPAVMGPAVLGPAVVRPSAMAAGPVAWRAASRRRPARPPSHPHHRRRVPVRPLRRVRLAANRISADDAIGYRPEQAAGRAAGSRRHFAARAGRRSLRYRGTQGRQHSGPLGGRPPQRHAVDGPSAVAGRRRRKRLPIDVRPGLLLCEQHLG